jgi:nuclear pore complex protein Nup107
VNTYSYDDVSRRKSYEILKRHLNFFDLQGMEPIDEDEAVGWELMTQQSRTYYELTLVVTAIEALAEWRAEEEKYITRVPKPSTVPSALKDAYSKVRAAMEPVLKGLLIQPTDLDEARDLDWIRLNYIPEMLIAYNTVLHAAGNLITRDSLLDSMELAASIARSRDDDEADNGLREAFVRAGRMRELVQSFAFTSKAMLVLKAEGKEWRPRKERKGQDLGMWELGRVGVEEEEVAE